MSLSSVWEDTWVSGIVKSCENVFSEAGSTAPRSTGSMMSTESVSHWPGEKLCQVQYLILSWTLAPLTLCLLLNALDQLKSSRFNHFLGHVGNLKCSLVIHIKFVNHLHHLDVHFCRLSTDESTLRNPNINANRALLEAAPAHTGFHLT